MKLFAAMAHHVEGDGRMYVEYESTTYFAVYAENENEAWKKARRHNSDTETVKEVSESLTRDQLLQEFDVGVVR